MEHKVDRFYFYYLLKCPSYAQDPLYPQLVLQEDHHQHRYPSLSRLRLLATGSERPAVHEKQDAASASWCPNKVQGHLGGPNSRPLSGEWRRDCFPGSLVVGDNEKNKSNNMDQGNVQLTLFNSNPRNSNVFESRTD